MKAVEAVLLALRANAEAEAGDGRSMPIGRTVLQKLVYFVSLKINVDIGHYAHYYGPFSEDVSMEIARLWGHGLVQENAPTRTKPGYTYTLTKGGELLGERVAGENEREYAEIVSVVRECRGFCELRHKQLAFASKIHYLRARMDTKDPDLISTGRKIGWVMGEDDVSSGFRLLHRLGAGKAQAQAAAARGDLQ
ncbi:MAG: hypothetical protein OXU37_05725 [Thaumarchaeota archaeon]|nr:hypothetical protein [Nitrososphaerota archaeon]